MIIFLHGPDSYRREERHKELVSKFRLKHPLAVMARIDAAEAGETLKIPEIAGSRSLFDSHRLVILENAYELPKEHIQTALAPHRDSMLSVFIISEDAKPPKQFDVLFKKLPPKETTVIVEEFEFLEASAWGKFIAKIAAREGIALTAEASAFCAGYYAKDTWGAVTELQKLAMLGKTTIDVGDIESASAPELPSFFGMLSSLKSARAAQRLAMLERLFAAGEPAAKIFHILAYQGGNAPAFARYDYAVKSGKLDYEEALLDALL